MITFCTIITADYIHSALSLYNSLKEQKSKLNFDFCILIANDDIEFKQLEEVYNPVKIVYTSTLYKDKYTKRIQDKYQNDNLDCFRWSMKPVLLKYLLEIGYDQAFYLDSDIYFYNSFSFLIEELENNSILLSPHWRSPNPYVDQRNFHALLTQGLFNGGFVGASKKAVPALEWWAKVCTYECTKASGRGLYVDQGYLHLMPIYFEGVKIIKHKGCNVAAWNQIECKRSKNDAGQVLINGKWEIIFVHFSRETEDKILFGDDKILKPYLDKYRDSRKKFSSWIPKDYKSKSSQQKKSDPLIKKAKRYLRTIKSKLIN